MAGLDDGDTGTGGAVGAVAREFAFVDRPVRMFVEDGEPIIVSADLCGVLEIAHVGRAMSRLDADEKGVRIAHTLGGPQEMAVVTEAGMYRLVMSSRKPQAKAFLRWLTHEVLPSIRRTGSYSTSRVSEAASKIPAVKPGFPAYPWLGTMPIDQIPLTLNEFFSLYAAYDSGPDGKYKHEPHRLEAALLNWIGCNGWGAEAARHPARDVWVFRRAVLEEWLGASTPGALGDHRDPFYRPPV